MPSIQTVPYTRHAAVLLLLAQSRVALRHAGDVPGHDFHGNQWTGGKGKEDPAVAAEIAAQQKLADAQTNPLAHPPFVLGLDYDLEGTRRYVAAYGQEFKAAPLPDKIERGTPKECYSNATHLLMDHPEYDYAEGFAQSDRTGGLSFLHAWAVDKAGNVIDPTWDRPENAKYFGVRYDRRKYLASLYKAKVYGVLGSTYKVASKVIATGGKKIRALGDVEGHEFHGNQWTHGGFTASPKDALDDLVNGDHANVAKEDLRAVVDRALRKDATADLTKLHVEGTPLFHGGSNVPRDKMPQVPKEHRDEMLAAFKQKGITSTREDVSALKLLPSQSEINAALVGEKLAKLDKGKKDFLPALVSKDNYVLDGHHHWAAAVVVAIDHPGTRIPIVRLSLDRVAALRAVSAYARAHGYKSKALTDLEAFESLGDVEGHDFHGNQWTGPNAKDDIPPAFPFASQAPQYPEKGPPGISYFKGIVDNTTYVDALLHRDKQGKVTGILNHYPKDMPPWEKKGNVNIFVDPAHKREGIGTALLKEASKRWSVSLEQQRYTSEGRRFITSLIKKNPKLRELGGAGSGNFGHAGRPGEVGGSAETGSAVLDSDRAKFDELKARWSRVNDELFQLVDRPDSPEAQAKIDELKAIVKEMHTLHVDPGGLEGIGLPGGPRDVVIVGAGPGGLAAATMAGTDGLDTLLIDANTQVGGQAKFSSRVENYPGFPAGITGDKLAAQMHEQALRVGADQRLGVAVTGMTHDPVSGLKTLTLSDGSTVETRSVILAGGVEFKKAEFPGANDSKVSYADSAKVARAGAGGDVVIAGGSNGAAQAALLAAKESNHVTLISRKPIDASMSDYQVRALRDHPKITVLEGHEIDGLKGNIVTTSTGRKVQADAVGIFFGGRTNSGWLPTQIQRSTRNKVIVNGSLETHMPGVFAVGDMREGSIGRIGQSVGDGQMAVHGVFQHFEKLKGGKK